MSVGNFYISINYPSYFNDFSLPSIIYFINFSLFQVRFLFIIWRFQNVDENEIRLDEIALRRKLFKIYALLCKNKKLFSFIDLCLCISLLMIYFILMYKWVLISFIIFTFIPQIIHNYQINLRRNRLPYNTIFVITINKLFFPVIILYKSIIFSYIINFVLKTF